MGEVDTLEELRAFAESYEDAELSIKKAHIALDESRDGEPVARVLLLLQDPEDDTWSVDRVRELRLALGQRATELGLPTVSLTLVAESERDEAGVFAQ